MSVISFTRRCILLGRTKDEKFANTWRRCYGSSQLNSVLKKLKLARNETSRGLEGSRGALEVLKPNHESLDTTHIRSRQPHVLYVRTELVLQRLDYLRPMGLQQKQKRKLMEKSPPLLLLVENFRCDQVAYLRGLVRDGPAGEGFVHFCHPYPSQVLIRVFDLRKRVSQIQEELGMAAETVLRYLLHMPACLLHEAENCPAKFRTFHKFALPKGYDLDKHTAEVLPPVCKPGVNVSVQSNVHGEDSSGLPSVSGDQVLLEDVLDYSYPQHYGSGQTEDLTSFLLRAERSELKTRYNKVM